MNRYAIIGAIAALTLFGTAYAQMVTSDVGSNAVWNWDTSNIYRIHQVHVGDRVYVSNTDTKLHSIRGSDSAGEVFQSGAIYAGGQYEMTFLWPGNFTYYDEYNTHNFGVIEIYAAGQGFPLVANYTASRDSYPGAVYYSSLADNSTVIPDAGPILGFSGTSNATLDLTATSNATQAPSNMTGYMTPPAQTNATNDTVAYWKGQSQMWEDKYDNLLSALRAILG